jgi:hypothetical protein
MLSLLLDEQISPVIAAHMTRRRPAVSIQSIFYWRRGTLATHPDHVVLSAAAEDGLTLVTFDLSTILPLVTEWGAAGTTHEGVIFVNQRTIRSDDFGRLIRALEQLWVDQQHLIWTNRIHFLGRPAGEAR